jgi:nucleoside-diphosphate-sugar epimerase
MHYREDYGIETRIVRFHNIFGPLALGTGVEGQSGAVIEINPRSNDREIDPESRTDPIA